MSFAVCFVVFDADGDGKVSQQDLGHILLHSARAAYQMLELDLVNAKAVMGNTFYPFRFFSTLSQIISLSLHFLFSIGITAPSNSVHYLDACVSIPADFSVAVTSASGEELSVEEKIKKAAEEMANEGPSICQSSL
jgi:hypothetical protein